MKATTPALLLLCGTMAAAMPVHAQPQPASAAATEGPATQSPTADELAKEINAALANIPTCDPTSEEMKRRTELLALQIDLKAAKTSAQLQSISERLKIILESHRAGVSLVGPAYNPANIASTAVGSKSVSLGLGGSDSFNREVTATAAIQYNFGNQPAGETFRGKAGSRFYSTGCSEYIFNIKAIYDDKWKASPAAYSNLTQLYSGEVLHLSNLLHAHTVFASSAYHDNSQGVLYDVEPAFGLYFRWPGNPNSDAAASKPSNYQAILGLAAQADIDMQYGNAHATTLGGLHTYLLLKYGAGKDAKNALGFNLRGFLPAIETAANGHASAIVTDDYKLAPQWSLSFSVLDSYFSTVPASYSHNSLTPTFGVKFTAQASK